MFLGFLTASAVALSGATRSLRSKPHHEALLVTSETQSDQLSTRAGVEEKMSRLESQTKQLVSFVSQVEDGLTTGLKEFQILANVTKPTANKTEPKLANVTKAAKAAPITSLNKLSPAEFKKAAKEEQDVLQDLFKHLKVNIASFNKQETHDKDKTEAIHKKLQARLKRDKATLAMKNISDFEHERLTNATRMEAHELEYWSRDRDLQHHMFHSNLKMTHGLMSRVKSVLEAYKEAFNKGHVDAHLLKKVHDMSPTKVAFLEMRKDVKERAHLYKVHLRLGMQIAHPPRREAGSII